LYCTPYNESITHMHPHILNAKLTNILPEAEYKGAIDIILCILWSNAPSPDHTIWPQLFRIKHIKQKDDLLNDLLVRTGRLRISAESRIRTYQSAWSEHNTFPSHLHPSQIRTSLGRDTISSTSTSTSTILSCLFECVRLHLTLLSSPFS
jgi:hypothetical protein